MATSPVAEYAIHVANDGDADVILEALPTQPIDSAHELSAAVSIDDGLPIILQVDQANDENNKTWQANALRNAAFARGKLTIAAGDHVLKLWGADPSVVVQRITLNFGRMQPSYMGPGK